MSEMPVEAHGDHVHAHARRTGHHWFDITMAVTAIFISIVSLYVAVQHGHTERDLVAANSWPFPTSFSSDRFEGRDEATFGMINSGTGPAKITSVQVAYKGDPVTSPKELLQRCCGAPLDQGQWHRTLPEGSLGMSSIDGSVLRAGQQVTMLIVRHNRSDAAVADRFAASLPDISLVACYCSVLDECWISPTTGFSAKRVKACAAPAHPYAFSRGGY